tara:strand:- start:301 stop:1116 length:816 start_codon:yes stop_codon:yes gene_type:complete
MASPIVKGQAFGATETVTAAKLQNIVDNSAFKDFDGSTEAFNVSGSSDIGTCVLAGGLKVNTSTGQLSLKEQANLTALGNTSGGSAVPTAVSILDEDTMSSDSATSLATQQSIKAYVDAHGIVQRTRVASSTELTVLGSSVIPLDNTLPQSGEGTEVLTTSFTPKSTSNRIEVSFNGLIVHTDPGPSMVLALFEGTTCKAAQWFTQPTNGANVTHVTFQFTPSSTDAATYSIRIGNGTTQTNPLYVNRQSNATATLGGLMEYSMTVLELKV